MLECYWTTLWMFMHGRKPWQWPSWWALAWDFRNVRVWMGT